jgi:hypothetical protein
MKSYYIYIIYRLSIDKKRNPMNIEYSLEMELSSRKITIQMYPSPDFSDTRGNSI